MAVQMVALGLVPVALVAIMVLRPDLATGIFLTYRIIVMLGAAILKVALGGVLTFFGFRVRDENSLWEVIGALTFLRGWVIILKSLRDVTSIAPLRNSRRDYLTRGVVMFRHDREALMFHWRGRAGDKGYCLGHFIDSEVVHGEVRYRHNSCDHDRRQRIGQGRDAHRPQSRRSKAVDLDAPIRRSLSLSERRRIRRHHRDRCRGAVLPELGGYSRP